MRIGGFSLTFCNALEMLACGELVSCPLFVLYGRRYYRKQKFNYFWWTMLPMAADAAASAD